MRTLNQADVLQDMTLHSTAGPLDALASIASVPDEGVMCKVGDADRLSQWHMHTVHRTRMVSQSCSASPIMARLHGRERTCAGKWDRLSHIIHCMPSPHVFTLGLSGFACLPATYGTSPP